MAANAVLSYRWRTDSTHDNPNKWKPGSRTWAENETLGMVRCRIIKSFNEIGQNVDFARASDHTPELWLCDENGNPTKPVINAKALRILAWTPTTADHRLFAQPDPEALILFTFPLKTNAEGNRTDTQTAIDKHMFPADDPLALNDTQRLVAGSPATPSVHPTAADAAASHTTPSTDTLVGPMSNMHLGDPTPSLPTTTSAVSSSTSPPVIVLPKDAQKWTKDHVSEWLRQNELGEHIALFRENEVNGETLVELTFNDLQNGLNIRALSERKKILAAIQKLKQVAGSPNGVMDDAGRHRWQRIARETRSYSHGMDGLCLVDDKFLNEVMDRLITSNGQHAGKVLIRGPPGCGKTTFADKFCEKFEGQFPIYNVSLLHFNPRTMDYKNVWPTFWSNAEIAIDQIIDRAKTREASIIVIIDECQMWYDQTSFWKCVVKDKPHNLKFLFLAAFGEPNEPGLATPDEVGNCYYGFDDLCLSLDKTKEIAEKLPFDRAQFFPETLRLLHDLTKGHARITRGVLKDMAEKGSLYATLDAQKDYLKEPSTVVDLVATFRSFKMLPKFIEELQHTADLFDVFMDVLFKAKYGPVHVTDYQLRGLMVRSGMFVTSSNASAMKTPTLGIICPFAFDVLLAAFLRGKFYPQDSQDSFEEFLKRVILAVDTDRLWASINDLGNSDLKMSEILVEDFFQKEFYRAITTILSLPVDGNLYLIETDVGSTPDAKTKCDFVISGKLGWAIELVCNADDRITEHLERMDPVSSSYRHIKAKRRAVVNIMFKDDYTPQSYDPILWHVVYASDEEKTVTIFQPKAQASTGPKKPAWARTYTRSKYPVIVNASMRSPTA